MELVGLDGEIMSKREPGELQTLSLQRVTPKGHSKGIAATIGASLDGEIMSKKATSRAPVTVTPKRHSKGIAATIEAGRPGWGNIEQESNQ